jgi:hypothetical protein
MRSVGVCSDASSVAKIGSFRHLLRRSDLYAIRCKADVAPTPRNSCSCPVADIVCVATIVHSQCVQRARARMRDFLEGFPP